MFSTKLPPRVTGLAAPMEGVEAYRTGMPFSVQKMSLSRECSACFRGECGCS